MQRRHFIKNTALTVMAVSATGFIRFNGTSYEGDCETTSDILGPFYRPGSPERSRLLVKGDPGTIVELSGHIRQSDCKTACKNAKVELWHCSSTGEYDNSSNDYRYRGTVYTDDKGNYSFTTVFPVPYDAGGGLIRPAHFHLLVTAAGYPSLVTQLYFSGDKNIAKDPWASASHAKRRILEVQNLSNGSKKVIFDVALAGKISAEPASLDKLTGIYSDEKDHTKKIEIFKSQGTLWMKNEVFGEQFAYAGNNTFRYADQSAVINWTLEFEILASGAVKLTVREQEGKGEEKTMVAIKK